MGAKLQDCVLLNFDLGQKRTLNEGMMNVELKE